MIGQKCIQVRVKWKGVGERGKWKGVGERGKTSKQRSFSAWWRRRTGRRKKKKEKRCPFNFLNTLSAVHWQFLLLPPVKYKSRCFSNISSNYVHVPIVVLTDCVHVIILLNSINQLGSVIGIQHVYCKVRTAFLYTQFNFRFQKGQLIRYRDILWTFFSKCS